MQDIKAGKIDEDGMGINNVESALARVDIKLRDSATSFRDMSSVLQELSNKWKDLNEIEQANIAKAIAGVRQQNLFRVLMDNMTNAIKLQTEQYNSAGLATERYQIYLKSVEAAQNKLKATTEGLWQDTIQSGAVTGVLNFGTAVVSLIRDIGGLSTVLQIVVPLLVAFRTQSILAGISTTWSGLQPLITGIQTMITSMKNAIPVFGALTAAESAALSATGIGAIALAFAGFVTWMNYLATASQRAARTAEDLRGVLEQTGSRMAEISAESSTLKDSWAEFDALKKKISDLGDISKLSNEEQEKFYSLQAEIIKIVPQANYYYDEQGRKILENSVNLKDLLSLKQQELDLQREKLALDAGRSADAEVENLKQINNQIDLLKAKSKMAGDKSYVTQGLGKIESKEEYNRQIRERENELALAKVSLVQAYRSMGAEARNAFVEAMRAKGRDDIIDALFPANDSQKWADYGKAWAKRLGVSENNSIEIPVLPKLDEQGFAGEAQKIKTSLNDLSKYIEKSTKGEDFTTTELAALREMGLEYQFLDGKVRIAAYSVEDYTKSLLTHLEANYQLDASQKRIIQNLIDMANANAQTEVSNYGVTMSVENYTKAIEEASQALWKQAQDSSAVMQFMASNGIESLNQLYNFMYQGGPAVQQFFEKLAIVTGTSVADIMKQFMSQYSMFVNGILHFQPETPQFVPAIKKAGGKTLEEIRIDREIKALENKKKALQDQLDDFNKYIEAQKLALKLQKEEADFQDRLAEKNKSLAKLKADIALLSLDNSQEAINKRLELEDQATKLEKEITKDKEDRKYDLQIQALEKVQKAFEDRIKAQIAGIDNTIEEYRTQAQTIRDAANGVNELTENTQRLGFITQSTGALILEALTKQFNLTEKNKSSLQQEINKWIEKKGTIEQAYAALLNFAQLLSQLDEEKLEMMHDAKTMSDEDFYDKWGVNKKGANYHSGGWVGGLESNEEFATLLKGEKVSTVPEMSNFLKKVLPRVVETSQYIANTASSSVVVHMPVTVSGNLDRSVLPDLKEFILGTFNDAMRQKGQMRGVGSFAI